MQPFGPGFDERDEDIDAPEPEDDRGDGGQHLDDGPKDGGETVMDEILGEEDGDGDGDAEDSSQKEGQQ